jgi:YHS domain-containing protein
MAAAKCRYDKKPVNTKTAFKVVIKDKNTYWCSEQCYKLYCEALEEMAKIEAEYNEIFEITKEIFGYEFTLYSLLRKEVNTWIKLSSRKNIILYLKENKDWLSTIMSKEFNSDYHRVRYYSTVVASKLHDFKPKVQEIEKPKVVVEEQYETKYKRKARKALADFEEDCDE